MQPRERVVVQPGWYLTPHELNAEVREVVQASHALAEDNFGEGVLSAAPVVVNAFGGMWEFERTTSQNSTIPAADQYGEYQPIPNSSGTAWVESVTTGDCLLEGVFGVTMRSTGGTPVASIVWVGVVLDGVLVAQSPMGDYTSLQDSADVEFAEGVGAGAHRLELVFGYHASPTTAQTIEWNEGNLVVREVAR